MNYRTAIKRGRLSAPMSALQSLGLLQGRLLDFGCGHGEDAQILGAEGYDPHFGPGWPEGLFDTITCQYVLNVLRYPEERRGVLMDLAGLLQPEGRAYITVRTDKRALAGPTSRGWQGLIELDLPAIIRRGHYRTYVMGPLDWSCAMSAKIFTQFSRKEV